MPLDAQTATGTQHVLTVFDAADFRCVSGVNQGDPLRICDEFCLGDSYRLSVDADPIRIELTRCGDSSVYRLDGPQALTPGQTVQVGPTLTMMTAAGNQTTMRCLLLEDRVLLLPVGQSDLFSPQAAIALTEDASALPRADPTCLAFSRGTRVTTQDGKMVPIENITPGTRLLTREGRGAPVLAVLSHTLPAFGRSTRVIIRQGAFANETELVVAAEHRLYVPARRGDLDPNGPDRMEPALKLVNGLTITADPGGTTEYFHVVLERHEIIYAEGIPCESFLLDEAGRQGLSAPLLAQLADVDPDLVHQPNPASLPPSERPQPRLPQKPEADAQSLRKPA